MTGSFLERVLNSTLPSFQERWMAIRRTYPPDAPPSAEDYLGHLVAHVQHAIVVGRVAEVTRFFLALERLLTEGDPMLVELLERHLVAPLAAQCIEAEIDERLVLPHLGPRSRAAWQRGASAA